MIIGLSGRKRSGKSTLGAAVEKEFGFRQLAFADSVREFIAAAFGWDLSYVHGDGFKSGYHLTVARSPSASSAFEVMSGRELLQRIGTDAARKIFGVDCWVNVGMKKARDTCKFCDEREHLHDKGVTGELICRRQASPWGPQHYVFTDVRFPNEVKAIQDAGGKVIRLNTAESVTTLHDYVAQYNDNCPETGECQYQGQEPDGNLRDCELPAAAHPCPFPVDRHVSECSLPDVGDYNLTLTGPLDVNTTAAVNAVKGWLAK